jgi:hypothetical protein
MMMTATTAERLVDELTDAVIERLTRRGLVLAAAPTLRPQYDAATCAALAGEVGDNPLNASEVLFGLLAKNGEVGATKLAIALGVPRTPTIAFVLTTPIKRVSTRLGLPWPFDVDTGGDGRTLWRDRDGIAARMLDAIRAEKKRRGL